MMTDGTVILGGADILMTPVNGAGGIDFVSGMSQLQKDLNFITIDTEEIVVFGSPHGALGNAQLDTAPGRLIVSNLGSSGQDGVRISLGEADSFDAAWDPLDPASTAPLGSFLSASAIGSIAGVPELDLGRLDVTKTASSPDGFEVTADFTAFAGPTERVQVLQGGTIVLDLPGNSLPILTTTWPCGLGKLGGQTECIVGKYDPLTSFTVQGIVVQGDELRVLAEGASGQVEFKSDFLVQAGELDQVVFTSNLPSRRSAPPRRYGSERRRTLERSLPVACRSLGRSGVRRSRAFRRPSTS